MPHYFTNDATDKKEYRLSVLYGGRNFDFITSDGVFSKNGLDDGSKYLLDAVLPIIPETDEITAVDLGCGYGALSVIIAALRPCARFIMIDVNEQAVILANKNASGNGLAGRVNGLVGDGLSGVTEPADLVVTNPPFRAGKATVFRFFEESLGSLKPGGSLCAVLRKQQGAFSYIGEIQRIFGDCQILLKKKGYVVVMATKGGG